MTHPSKRKGNRYEREIVEEAEAKGLEAERAFASDGRSLGEAESCDVLIRGNEAMITDSVRVQAKRRKSIAQYITPDEEVDIQVVRENYGDSLAIVPLGDYLELLREATDGGEEKPQPEPDNTGEEELERLLERACDLKADAEILLDDLVDEDALAIGPAGAAVENLHHVANALEHDIGGDA